MELGSAGMATQQLGVYLARCPVILAAKGRMSVQVAGSKPCFPVGP
jgi:hypothetical protein